jgi:transposase
MGMPRGDFTDEQWKRLEPLLPPQRPKVGRPNKDHRLILNGICWVLRTGAPWRDVPRAIYGPWRTLSSRFYRWIDNGVWDRILRQLQIEAEHDGDFDWSLHFVDGSIVRAHQHAAGARGTPEKGGRRKRSVTRVAASAPRSTSAPREAASLSSSC